MKVLQRNTNIPLSLYIHFPWCLRKCPYCDFLSYPCSSDFDENIYIDAVVRDLQQELFCLGGNGGIKEKISSIYIGGGTPSLLSVVGVQKLLTQINYLCEVVADAEITIESNPGTIDSEYCRGLLDCGVTRLSIGVQSLQDEKLRLLGRIHDAVTACQSVVAAQLAGFRNINLDLMFGLPQQSVADALYDLQAAINLAPMHISWYQFTLEKGTVFYTQPPEAMPDVEVIWQMENEGKQFLSEQGFMQYEVSAYCRGGQKCLHNLNYWQFGDYLGVGVGAHGKLTVNDEKSEHNYLVTRYSKLIQPHIYCTAQQRNDFVASEEVIATENLSGEFMMNALRLYQAVPLSLFVERTGLPLQRIENELQQAVALGLLTLTADSMITTNKGKNFLNDLIQIFM